MFGWNLFVYYLLELGVSLLFFDSHVKTIHGFSTTAPILNLSPKHNNIDSLSLQSPFIKTNTRTTTTKLRALEGNNDDTNRLEQLVENIEKTKSSVEQLKKLEELEAAVSKLLGVDTKKLFGPMPPNVPPPDAAFLVNDIDDENITPQQKEELKRLQEIKAAAKFILQRQEVVEKNISTVASSSSSPQQQQQQQKILQQTAIDKAEAVLKKSRETAEAKTKAAIRRTEAAVAVATKRAQEEKDQADILAAQKVIDKKSQSEKERRKAAIEKKNLARKKANEVKAGVSTASKITTTKTTTTQPQKQKNQQQRASTRPTFSLESIFGFGSNEDDEQQEEFYTTTTNQKAQTLPSPIKVNVPPTGIPYIYQWQQNADGSIIGKVADSENFNDGLSISTSPVAAGATHGTIVTTATGSRYYLASGDCPINGNTVTKEASRQNDFLKRYAEAEARRQNEEAQAAKAVQNRTAMAMESAAKASTLANNEQRDAKQKATNNLQQQQQNEAQRRVAAKERIKAAEKRREEAQKTFSKSAIEAAEMIRRKRKESKLPEAPPGVPSIRSWVQRNDGGISGRIFGSPNSDDGDFIETSPLVSGTVDSGYLVQTATGSTYYLSAEKFDKEQNILSALQGLATAKPGSTIQITRQRMEKDAKTALDGLRKAAPRQTISLFNLFGLADDTKNNNGKSTMDVPVKPGPAGVPSLARWKRNRDGSLTGIVFGSSRIKDGVKVTTSRIIKGLPAQFETVQTASGSFYYLL